MRRDTTRGQGTMGGGQGTHACACVCVCAPLDGSTSRCFYLCDDATCRSARMCPDSLAPVRSVTAGATRRRSPLMTSAPTSAAPTGWSRRWRAQFPAACAPSTAAAPLTAGPARRTHGSRWVRGQRLASGGGSGTARGRMAVTTHTGTAGARTGECVTALVVAGKDMWAGLAAAWPAAVMHMTVAAAPPPPPWPPNLPAAAAAGLGLQPGGLQRAVVLAPQGGPGQRSGGGHRRGRLHARGGRVARGGGHVWAGLPAQPAAAGVWRPAGAHQDQHQHRPACTWPCCLMPVEGGGQRLSAPLCACRPLP